MLGVVRFRVTPHDARTRVLVAKRLLLTGVNKEAVLVLLGKLSGGADDVVEVEHLVDEAERKSRHIASATCCAQLSSARREPRAPQDLPALIVALDPVSEPRRGFLCSRGSHLPPVAQGLDIARGIGDGRRIGSIAVD